MGKKIVIQLYRKFIDCLILELFRSLKEEGQVDKLNLYKYFIYSLYMLNILYILYYTLPLMIQRERDISCMYTTYNRILRLIVHASEVAGSESYIL